MITKCEKCRTKQKAIFREEGIVLCISKGVKNVGPIRKYKCKRFVK